MTSVMVTLSKIVVVLMIAAELMLVMSRPLTLIPSSSTVQLQPPVSIVYHRAEDLDDYGIWDPSPVSGGGKAAPLPNSQEKSF